MPGPKALILRCASTVCLCLAIIRTAIGSQPAEPADYLRDVKPLLRSRCVACHGPIRQEAGLRLDAAKLVSTGSNNGPVAIPGQSESSLLIERVSADDADERMPPQGAALSSREIAVLKSWIDAGAPAPADETIAPTPREHWAFQPIRRMALPQVVDIAWPRNAIDHFVLARLEAKGWRPNPPASRQALLRRAYLDLIGLPPTPGEQDLYLQTSNPDAYENLIRSLLANPAYGERYARRWLDVVRYADSNGYERDAAKPEVWRYRDYVIRAFNADLPFDRFVQEQMAGDELANANADTIVATGLHRLGPWDDEPADAAADRFDQLDDIVNTTSQAFLALTMGCARCHDHKFDPLTQRDYYSLLAVFNPLVRPREGRKELTLPIATPALRRELSDEQKKSLPQGYFLDEPAAAPPATHILARGNPHEPLDEVDPAVPAILAAEPVAFLPPDKSSSRRRLSLARWLASPENPLTARVIVNRVWQWHFGEGLVRTPNDFGLSGERPTHPELLDYLAWWFMNEAGWSLKELHYLIVTSSVYQQSHANREEYAAVDPQNRLLWKRSLVRLEVEPIRDSILAASGQLNRTMYGPPVYPLIPREALESHADKTSIWPAYDEQASARRTVYAFTKRSLVVPLLEVFDLCDTTRSSPQRNVTTVPTQALTLFNSEFIAQQAAHFARRLRAEAGDLDEQIDRAWRLALCRRPTADEAAAMQQFFTDEIRQLRSERGDAASESELADEARLQLCRVLFNLNEFVYPD